MHELRGHLRLQLKLESKNREPRGAWVAPLDKTKERIHSIQL